MSEELIVAHCSPTLAGLKTGNMFTCAYQDKEEVYTFLRKWNSELSSKGVRLLPLCLKDGRALIYVYRPSKLNSDLRNDKVCSLLCERGYCIDNCGRCLASLMKRFAERDEFPHEIGLFLGYPPEDVEGFIENKACGSKCVGCWKVYGDADKAQKEFNKFKKCKKVYKKQWENGKSITKLTITR